MCRKQCVYAHCDGARRHLVESSEAVRHLVTRCLVDRDESACRREARTRLVGSDVAHASDTEQGNVEAAFGSDELLVGTAMLKHIFLFDASVGSVHVLGFHINMIKQTLTELSYRTVFAVGAERGNTRMR